MPFSSLFVSAVLWMEERRRRASLKAGTSSEYRRHWGRGCSGGPSYRKKPVQRTLVEALCSTRSEIERSCPQISESAESIAPRCIDKVLLPSAAGPKDRLDAFQAGARRGSESQISVVSA